MATYFAPAAIRCEVGLGPTEQAFRISTRQAGTAAESPKPHLFVAFAKIILLRIGMPADLGIGLLTIWRAIPH
ncbi:hypothetical protein [Novosphingobium sp. G106]|uniref:hypothetical protein n=1 Tax=Novosphingobium sp. G106 TaxID=2849500 RepID=UPI0020C1F320|nr:hypothetical protein [Novosphingobium sp. G106]